MDAEKKPEDQNKDVDNAKKTDKEEDTKKTQWQEANDDEDLESFRPDPDCQLLTYDERVYGAFAKLTNLTRELSTDRSWQIPEVLFVGKQGEGKTSVVEVMLGHAVYSGAIKRPILFNLVNNMECEVPKVTFKKDGIVQSITSDTITTIEKIPDEIKKRDVASEEPIHIRYEYRNVWNMVLIDAPGLLPAGEKGEQERESMVIELTKPQDRFLVFIEEAKEWEKCEMFAFAEKLDPKLRRSLLVFTKFNYQLSNFSTLRDLNLYLSARPSSKIKSFFISKFSHKTWENNRNDPKKFKTKLEQSIKRDFELLDKLKYDKKGETMIGAAALRKYVLELTFKKYSDSIPDLVKQVRTLKKTRADSLAAIQQQIKTLDNNKLRSIASNYVSEILQYLVALLQGSLEGNPTANGQNLEEEKAVVGEWYSRDGAEIKVDPQELKVPNFDTKLYGGQQFERLLAEFRLVCNNLSLEKLSMDDIATAAGLSGLKTVPTHIWAASDLAQRKCNQVFAPLMTHLIKRACYITKRIFEIVENIVEAKKKRTTLAVAGKEYDASLSISKDFPQFTWFVKDLFEDAIDSTAKLCMEKCMDELHCTRLVYWEHTSKNLIDNIVKTRNGDSKQTQKSVEALASDIFKDQLRRITKNITLKCYDNFLVKMSKSISSDIQGKVASMTDDQMSDMFDLASTIDKLKAEEDDVKKLIEFDAELAFMESASKFRI